jgi:hypothetical protein
MAVTTRAYEEVVDFIAAGSSLDDVIGFHPSEPARQRVMDLLERAKGSGITPEEQSELDHYFQLEHLMRLAKARARGFAAHG